MVMGGGVYIGNKEAKNLSKKKKRKKSQIKNGSTE